MSRLFIGQRELDFISDVTKEIIKDVAGQKVFYYTVREDLSNVHDVYEESEQKIFDPPIEIEALVEWSPAEVKTTKFGNESVYTIQLYVHYRDMLDRGINFQIGDYFSYGDAFYETTSVVFDKLVYGQVERIVSMKVIGKQTRKQQINIAPLGPTSEKYSDPDAIQTTFEQQRGLNGVDKRQLVEDGVLEPPITGAKKVAPDGTVKSINGIGSSFYGDE